MADTVKYYDEVDEKLVDTEAQVIREALKYAFEKYCLTEMDINVLGRILAYRKSGNDDSGMYEHVVDFLWMSYRIGFNQKHLLLDLLNE